MTALTLDNPTPFGVTVAGTLEVTVVTPAPGGGTSAGLPFAIGNPVPVIDSIDPATARADQLPVTVTLRGSGFVATSTVSLGAGRFLNATTIEITVPRGTAAGAHPVTVTNPLPRGGTSNDVTFTVTNAAPVLTSLSPETALEGDVQTIDVGGENFVAGSEILLNGQAIATRFNGPTSLSGTVFGLLRAGTYEITVSSPGAPTSGGLLLTVLEAPRPVPHITSITDTSTLKDGDTVTVTGTGFNSTTELLLDGRSLSRTLLTSTTFQFVVPSGGATSGSHTLTVINPASSGGGGGSSTFSFTVGAQTVTSAQIIVFNDTNIFDDVGMDDDFESDSSSNPNNKRLVRNLVGFTGTGTHASGTVVQFDCGRSSGFTHPCDSTSDFSTNTMKNEIVAAGYTVSVVNSSSGSISSIPSNVKVLFLWLPKVAFTGVEINALKQFASNGGRIVFVGEYPGFYGSSNITGVANPLLKDLGAKSAISTATAVDNGFTKVGASSINTSPGHQVTTGLTGIEHAATARMTVDSGDTVLWKDAAGSNDVAAAVKIDVSTQLPTAAPTLTSISPASVLAGQSAVTMTLTGTNFTPSSGVTLSSGSTVDINSNGVTYVSSTEIQVSLRVDSGANSQSYTFQVTTFNGSSSAVSFSIVTDRATITSISPSSGVRGSTIKATITGTRFTGATSISFGAGTVSSFTVDSDTQITAYLVLTISGGSQSLSVNNAAGAANSVTVTVTDSGITSASSLEALNLAGSTTSGTTDATGAAARFNNPKATWGDGQGNLYVADTDNHTIRKVVISSGVVTTLAGTAGTSGSTDDTGTAATFNSPAGIWSDGKNLYVSDTGNHTIRKVVIATGVVTTIAGSAGTSGTTDDTGTAARFNQPRGLWGDEGFLYVADRFNHSIRKIVIATGVVTTFAGSTAGTSGTTEGTGTAARFNEPTGIWGNGTTLYVADRDNKTIRKIVIFSKIVSTFAGLAGSSGSTDATGSSARFDHPEGLWGDGTNLYVTDTFNHTIRKIVISSQVVTTVAGSAGSSGSTNGTGTAARFNNPFAVWGDGTNLYVADSSNNQIRKLGVPPPAPTITSISPTSGTQGSTGPIVIAGTNFTGATVSISGGGVVIPVSTVTSSTQIDAVFVLSGSATSRTVTVTTAGGSDTVAFTINSSPLVSASPLNVYFHSGSTSGASGSTDDTGSAALFNFPDSIWGDGPNLYIADSSNHTIRKIVISTGAVSTIAGSALSANTTDGTGSTARFNSPEGLWGDGKGNLYVADTGNHLIRHIDLTTNPVTVTTIAGTGSAGQTDATGTSASFDAPHGLWGDGAGNLFIADKNNHVVRKLIRSNKAVTTFTGVTDDPGFVNTSGGTPKFNTPLGLWGDDQYLYVSEGGNHAIRRITLSNTTVITVAGTGSSGSGDNGTGTLASFNFPHGLWGDGTNLWVVDSFNNTIRKITLSTTQVVTVAGTAGTSGTDNAVGTSARFNRPLGVWSDGTSFYLVDGLNNQVRKLDGNIPE